MRNICIPPSLYTQEILSFIDDMIDTYHPNGFESIYEIHQDKFVALCMKALGNDVDIVLNRDGNKALTKFLISYDKDEEVEVIESLKIAAREKFYSYFDHILEERKCA